MTQDIYLAELKNELFDLDKSIFIVGVEQEYHFKVLFDILNRIGITSKCENIHYSYGYVYDKTGEKFSSRLGNTINADDLLEIIKKKAEKILFEKNENLKEIEIKKRSEIIGFAGLTFSFLKPNSNSSINFDIEKSLSFAGDTSSYILYTYARIFSIIKKSKFNGVEIPNSFELNNLEEELINKILEYKNVIINSHKNLKPSLICNYLIEMCRTFNGYYVENKIINNENEELRICLILSLNKVIKDCCEILGFSVLEEM
jgi:arginyl-tRNA synthetase